MSEGIDMLIRAVEDENIFSLTIRWRFVKDFLCSFHNYEVSTETRLLLDNTRRRSYRFLSLFDVLYDPY